METQHDTDLVQRAMNGLNGTNSSQVASGGFVIQVGAINGGQLNLGPAQSPPAAEEPSQALLAAEQDALLSLRAALSDRFGEEDLRDLAFDLAIEYDDLPGATRKDKARELVVYCHRRGLLPELKQAILQRRPGAL